MTTEADADAAGTRAARDADPAAAPARAWSSRPSPSRSPAP
ncbi:hypothetical protein O1L44_15255 [Streptomyces noursei]|nr:hypothetical protein [Streptomyces noursei]